MQPYQQRMIDEKRNLDDKRENLGIFIQSLAYQNLAEAERDLISQQALAMATYSTILGQRIAAF